MKVVCQLESGEQNNISHGKYYYWQRVIREEALIKAGTLAVTGKHSL